MQGVATVSDVRVEPFIQSKWGQSTSDNYYGSTNTCFNYYTPSNFVCGCVATAIAQIMRYWKYPTASVQVNTYPCYVAGVASNVAMMGGTYDWDNMPLVTRNAALSESQRQAIGKLCRDVGVTVEMNWTENWSSSSIYAGVACLPIDFGYANAKAIHFGTYDAELLKKALIPNLDARCPCGLSISGDGGHGVLVDGYGYSGGDFFLHLNMGWVGSDDAWYCPPALGTSQYAFNAINGVLFNVFPTNANCSIASGRVFDAAGEPVAGATVTLRKGTATVATAISDDNGIYAFIVASGSYVARAEKEGVSDEKSGISVGQTTGTTIVTTKGDRGSYYSGTGKMGNTYGNDIVLSGLAGVPAPVFSPESCLFHPSTNVVLDCADPDADIRYTLDGSVPDENSALFEGPLFVEDTVTITARAFAPGKNPSPVVCMAYTYDDSVTGPKGDHFADPIKIYGACGTRVIADNSAYGVEDGEPLHTLQNGRYSPQYRTVWYLWTAPGTGTMEFRTSAESASTIFQTAVAVYTGDTLDSATRLAFATACDSSYATPLSLGVEQGKTYRVVGMMRSDRTAGFTLSWNGELEEEVRSPYEIWADANGLSGPPAELTDGVANIFRYVFGQPVGALPLMADVSFDENGHPVLALPPVAHLDGVVLSLLSTADPGDWSSPAVSERVLTGEPDEKIVLDATAPARFHRLKAAVAE